MSIDEAPEETGGSAGMGIVPVFALREALINGMAVLVSDERAMLEMVEREDRLTYSRAEEWRRDLAAHCKKLADPQSVVLGYPIPLEMARLPCVSVVEQSGGENAAELYMGDLLRESTTYPVGASSELWLTTEVGGGYTSRVEIGTWAEHSETSMLLHAMTKWAIYAQKDRLYERGVHDLSIQTGGLELDPRLGPRIAYVPMVSVQLSWTLRQSFRRKVPNRVSSVRGTFTA